MLLTHLPFYGMEIYVLKEGRRCGPFLPFKLRELLEDKEFKPSDPGWIEGMDAWAPLSSIEAISNWMPRDPALPPPLPDPGTVTGPTAAMEAVTAAAREMAARRVRAWLRWLARTIDEMLWFLLLWLVGVTAGWLGLWDFLFRHPVLLFGPAIAWIPVEALLLSRFTTTPGKWLLGIRVTDDLGQPLGYVAALKRSALVLVIGNGLGLPIFTDKNYSILPVMQACMSWMLYQRSGTTLWDRAAGAELRHTPPSPLQYSSVGLICAAWLGLGMWINLTAPVPVNASPEQREKINQMQEEFQQYQEQWRQQLKTLPKGPQPPIGLMG